MKIPVLDLGCLVRKIKNQVKKQIEELKSVTRFKSNPLLNGTLKDGLLRIRITNRCNGKCRYCGIKYWSTEEQKRSMPEKWLYNYCVPLYEQIKILLLTGGDAFVAKESWNYCNFISCNYPQVTLFTESNGIAFDKKWQELAADNLFRTHFSLNATTEEIYKKGVWEGEGAVTAFRKIRENMFSYIDLLKSKDLEVFAPSFSMVINKDTACDVRNFIKMCLVMGASLSMFYFDYTESNMGEPFFGNPETSRNALRQLMEIERVLAKKFFVYFRLWIPLEESRQMQEEVEKIPLKKLEKKYADLLDLAKDRSMQEEYEERQRIRKEHGKKEFTFDEDWTPTIHQCKIGDNFVCSSPWTLLDIYPNGNIECCSWINPRIKILDYIKHDKIEWDSLYNSYKLKSLRDDMLRNDFNKCMVCCPLNPTCNDVAPPHKYGFDRVENNDDRYPSIKKSSHP